MRTGTMAPCAFAYDKFVLLVAYDDCDADAGVWWGSSHGAMVLNS